MYDHELFCETFQELLLQMRQENFITQKHLSLKSGISRQSIYLMEVGRRLPSFENFCELAYGVGVSPAELSQKFISIYQEKQEKAALKVAESTPKKRYNPGKSKD